MQARYAISSAALYSSSSRLTLAEAGSASFRASGFGQNRVTEKRLLLLLSDGGSRFLPLKVTTKHVPMATKYRESPVFEATVNTIMQRVLYSLAADARS